MSILTIDVIKPTVGSINASICDFFNNRSGDIKIYTEYSSELVCHILHLKQGRDQVSMVKQEVELLSKVLQESLKIMDEASIEENL